MNPFEMKPERKAELFVDWEKLWVRPYSKREVDPYTRTRVILMNGTEFENVWFSHQFSRATGDNELRRKLALIRRSEQQRYTEIMPGRPTISHHRHPYDSVRWDMGGKKPVTIDVLAANVITAAEQQTMNYYMNTAALWPEETGRRLYQEIGMIEEQHVTQYGSLLNPTLTPLENLLVHQYVESWLYWSMCETETDPHIRGVWQMLFEQELMHLNIAQGLLREYEGKEWNEVLPDAEFPAPLRLESNIEYVRGVLGSTANNTADREDYVDVRRVTPETFAQYQRQVNQPVENVVSHSFIQAYIRKNGTDYRFETAPNPVAELKDRKADNVSVGRQTLCDESFTHTADDSVPIPELTR